MFSAIVLLSVLALSSGSALIEYQAWPASISHQSKFEVHPSPLEHYAPVYSAPLVSHYGYDGYGAYGGLLGHGHHLYKRSADFAPVVAPHIVPVAIAHALPAAVSHQSRVDVHQTVPFLHSPYHATAYGVGSPYAYSSHLYSPKPYGAYGYHW